MSTPLIVEISREPFMDWFRLSLNNGFSEELEPDDCREWFRKRGADMDQVEKCLDVVWNFYKADFVIENPKEPAAVNPALQPKL